MSRGGEGKPGYINPAPNKLGGLDVGSMRAVNSILSDMKRRVSTTNVNVTIHYTHI